MFSIRRAKHRPGVLKVHAFIPFWFIALTVVALVLSVGAYRLGQKLNRPKAFKIPNEMAAETTMGVANPASVYCGEQGGTLSIETDASGGQSGRCQFPDGTACDEWAFYRGECGNTVAVTQCKGDSNQDRMVNVQDLITVINNWGSCPIKPTPKPCQPRPACLDSNPACLLAEPSEGWCPLTSPKPTPTTNCIERPDCLDADPACEIALPPDGRTFCPKGCHYQQVQCIKAPCNPILVCDQPTPSPALAAQLGESCAGKYNRACAVGLTCNVDPNQAVCMCVDCDCAYPKGVCVPAPTNARCNLQPEIGSCKAAIPKYYFDSSTQSCKSFKWGGCGGVVPFDTLAACQKSCRTNSTTPSPKPSGTPQSTPRSSGGCEIGGCSGQLCYDSASNPEGMVSTCEWREEYACYRSATCARNVNGVCGWVQTESLKQCLGEN